MIISFILIFSVFIFALPVQAFSAASLSQWVSRPALSARHTGVNILSLKTGKVIYQKNATVPLIPASNMKLLTSAAGLSLLKPEYQFKTEVYLAKPVYQNKENTLYLKGYGDPDLNDERLFGLAQDLKYQGVTDIAGDLVVDDSYFDQQSRGKGWKTTYGSAAYNARISALSLNRNTVKVWVKPTQPGQAAEVQIEPVTRFFKIINTAYTSSGRTRLKIARTLENGQNVIRVSGNIYSRSAPEAETINLDKPSLYVGEVFKETLAKLGVRIHGKVLKGRVPQGAILMSTAKSPPLREIISDLNKHSVNLIGENLLKTLGAVYKGAPGTSQKGAAVIQEAFLQQKVGLPANNGVAIADGSGLSPQNRVTAHALSEVLRYMYHQFDVGADFVASLAVSGVEGTLKKRFRNPKLKRKIRAKTGYINRVSTLSGYLQTDSNDVVVFSVLMNHFNNYSVAVASQEDLFSSLLDYQE